MPDSPSLPINLFLSDLREIENGKLCIVVTEGQAGEAAKPIGDLGLTGNKILIMPDSRSFVLLWESYVALSVRDESFVIPDDDNPGGSFVERVSSSYLRFIRETSIAVDVLQKPLRHWQIACLNHAIDVVSTVAPSLGESKQD